MTLLRFHKKTSECHNAVMEQGYFHFYNLFSNKLVNYVKYYIVATLNVLHLCKIYYIETNSILIMQILVSVFILVNLVAITEMNEVLMVPLHSLTGKQSVVISGDRVVEFYLSVSVLRGAS